MKNSTKILLSLLHSPLVGSHRVLHASQVEWLLPEMTVSGRRSFFQYLQKQHLLAREPAETGWNYVLTQAGAKALLVQFPALSPAWDTWDGKWSCAVFRQAPVGDPQFRYLRSLLLQQGFVALSRGVFIYPGQVPPKVIELCDRLYQGAVVITITSDWTFGDERVIISELYNLQDVGQLYSGISKEMSRLLPISKIRNDSTAKQKDQFNDIFERYIALLGVTPGLFQHYFPHFPHPAGLLSQFQELI